MPIIHVELVEGRTFEQKKALGEAITKATVTTVAQLVGILACLNWLKSATMV